jgi:pyruvate kinase
VHPITSAVVAAAGEIAEQLGAKIVVIATRSGRTALAKAKQRDFVPTIAVSDTPATLRQMCLYWGIMPLAGAPEDLNQELIPFIDQWGRQQGILQPRDCVVIVAGTRVRAGAHNQLVVHQVE